ncbi:conjugative transposon protein TraO [Arcicella aurantiaca]|uniref:Conjugative transposon protein TraO n=1 Tax=Arcicella aurantiaca TaxID=591202 RepID=A0A316DGK9_9BACT|nr:conjugal transfer protein TraO [Arcicella aurantiaca]PWK16786.1 conjugative transposon protein TraO [Arcicella aurantiaca]
MRQSHKARVFSLFILLTMITSNLNAQVHIKSQKFFEVSTHVTDGFNPKLNQSGLGFGIGFGVYNKKENSWVLGLDYLWKNIDVVTNSTQIYLVPVEQFTSSYTYIYKFYRNRNRSMYMNFRTGGIFGYESVNQNERFLTENIKINNVSRFLLGASLGAEIEVHNLIISARQRWTPTSEVKPFYIQLGIALRFNQ